MIVSRAPASYRIFGGLGQAAAGGGIGPGTYNCPGDLECLLPGGTSIVPPPPVGDAAFWNTWGTVAGTVAGQQLASSPPGVPTGPLAPLSSFLSAYPSYAMWGVGILVALAFLSEGRR
jgi:hypothetical protein